MKENQDDSDIYKLFAKRKVLRTKKNIGSKQELMKVEAEFAEKCAEENYKKIKDELKDMEGDESGFNVGKFWKLRKKLCPYKKDPPTAMLSLCGNLVTSAENLEKHMIEHYEKVLSNRPINPELEGLNKDKESLCSKRMEIARQNKSDPWTIEDLEIVLKHLKKGKSRDPNDHINKLYNSEHAGNDLKHALIVLMNKIKEQLVYPHDLEACNISSIYKKGRRNLFHNYHGVFRLTVLRSILDRLIYNDLYPVIDLSLTDAAVGNKKGRNIRDNLFVVNAITNSIIRGNEEPCELGIYDAEKCFDSLWSQDCLNDLYEAGCIDDKLVLLQLRTLNANVAKKTSHG